MLYCSQNNTNEVTLQMITNRYISVAVVLAVLGISMVSAGYHNETEAKEATTTQVVEKTRMLKTTEVEMQAGVATLFAPNYKEEVIAYAASLSPEEIAEVMESEEEYSNLAIANVDNYVNVRKEPNTDSEIVGKMYDDSVAQILAVVGEGENQWFQVVSGNVEGYIKSEYFIYGDAAAEVIDDYVIRYAVVKADRLNVRKEPTTESSRIGYIDYGEKVKIIELGEEWHKVQYTDSAEGYVSAEYVTVEEEFVYAKSIEEERKEQEEQALLLARNAESSEVAPENTTVKEVIPPTDYSNVSELRQAIVNYAMQFVGGRYIHGGQSLAGGTDCSGFTCYTYAAFGYAISRTPQGQWTSNGRSISVSEIQPGDIVCYSSSGGKCTHVALYIGDGMVVHAFNPRKGITVSNMYYDNTFIGVKNVID